MRSTGHKKYRNAGAGLIALVLLLYVPDPAPALPSPAAAQAFVWDQDDVWRSIEARFAAARQAGCTAVGAELDAQLDALAADIAWIEGGGIAPGNERFDGLEDRLFAAASLTGACPQSVSSLVGQVTRLRAALKVQSRDWDLTQQDSRRRLYRLLYGGRTLVEELLLQGAGSELPTIITGTDEPSQTPAAVVAGVELHSGDILVSRGGAPVSALIARGNDYPGNFSHIALVHIDESGEIRIIEAHIEVGVTVSSAETYLADKKLRIMVLRLDHALEALRDDPLLPHRAATAALEEGLTRHVPYDFAMHYEDPRKKFCSEVASAVYAERGVSLWEGLTSMSSRGVTAWLSRLGVEKFETYGPSDLEYDPKMVVVAEWRDPEALFADHVDNAVIDALLEGAERGDELDYAYRALPLARIAKAYSVLLNLFGKAGPVPEGMSATRALRAQWLDGRHEAVKKGVLARVDNFRKDRGYTPPYWELLAMARASLAGIEG